MRTGKCRQDLYNMSKYHVKYTDRGKSKQDRKEYKKVTNVL